MSDTHFSIYLIKFLFLYSPTSIHHLHSLVVHKWGHQDLRGDFREHHHHLQIMVKYTVLTVKLACFLYPATLKIVGYYVYVIPSIQKIEFECPSVRPPVYLSICTSVPQRIVFTLLGAFFNQFSSNLLWELIMGRSVLGLQIGKFWKISTELRPLIYVRNWFSLSIFGFPLPIFFKLGMRVDIVKERSGIADG